MLENPKRKPGRPPDSAPAIPQVDHVPTICPACGSKRRESYYGTTTLDYAGERQGVPYLRIVIRRTSCSDCGQHRVDRCYE